MNRQQKIEFLKGIASGKRKIQELFLGGVFVLLKNGKLKETNTGKIYEKDFSDYPYPRQFVVILPEKEVQK